jgi:hypothetical protein
MALITSMAATAIGAGGVLAFSQDNDLRQNAIHIPALGSTLTGSTVGATSAGEPAPSCGLSVGKTVWFRFRAPIALRLEANTAGSDFDTVVQVYVATASGLSKVKCNDDGFGPSTPADVVFNAGAGKLYYFQLGGYGGASGNYSFLLLGNPRNDYFANAAVVKGLPFVYQEDTTNGSSQSGEPIDCGTTMVHSVWFKYKRSTTASVSADTFGSSFDTVLGLYRGTSLGSLSWIGCSDDRAGTLQSQITWTAVAGTTYYIQVTGSDYGDWGDLTFALTRN